jgi:DNA-binding response OmpR family regulator
MPMIKTDKDVVSTVEGEGCLDLHPIADKRILLVDDDPDMLGLAKQLLQANGATVYCAENGEEALNILNRRSLDLMVTDLNMPGLNGLELASKASSIVPGMPIVITTGDITPEIPRLAAEAGAKAVITKPFHPNELIAVIKNVALKSIV